MTGYQLIVSVPTKATFEAYYYGHGDVVSLEPPTVDRPSYLYTIDYGTDHFHCQYQSDRFGSGLYCAKIESYETEGFTYLT